MNAGDGPDVKHASTHDEDVLAVLFDELFNDVLAGHTTDIAGLLPDRPELRERLQEMQDLARRAAGRTSRELPTFAGYQIVRELGRGAMGTVFLARQENLGRQVALKMLPPALAISPRARQRFLEEARALARLEDEYIIHIHDIIERDDALAYAMEWIDGKTLQQVLDELHARGREASTRDLEKILGAEPNSLHAPDIIQFLVGIGITIARALDKVHRGGLVHRDVKPSNILMRRDGTPVLADFGLARGVDTSLTLTGTFVGKPVYAPPEQLRAREDEMVDGRADVYALGVSLYEAISGTPPFVGRNPAEVLRRVESGRVRRLRSVRPEASVDLDTIVLKAMEPDREHRYQTAAEMADDFDRLLRLEPIHARPAGPWRRSLKFAHRNRRPLIAATAAAALIVVILLPLLLLAQHEASLPERIAMLRREAGMQLLRSDLRQLTWRRISQAQPGESSWHLAGGLDLHRALSAYDAVLDLCSDPDAERERDVVSMIAQLDSLNELGVAGLVAVPVQLPRLGPLSIRVARMLVEGSPLRIAPAALEQAAVDDLRTLGLLAYLSGRLGLCEQAWQGLDVETSPFPLADAVLGLLHATDERPTSAFPRLTRAATAFPKASFLRLELAIVACAMEDVSLAQRVLADGSAFSHDDPLYQRAQAELHHARGDTAGARVLYETAAEGGSPTARLRLAQLDVAAGALHRAETRLRALVVHWPRVARYRLALVRVLLESGNLAGYFRHARYVLSEGLVGTRSAGTVRDLLEILRLGGLKRLYWQGVEQTGCRPPLARVGFPRVPVEDAVPFSSMKEVEAFLQRLVAFDKDSMEQFPLTESWGHGQRIAGSLSFLSRSILHFPQVLAMCDPRTRWTARAGAHWTRSNWSLLTRTLIPTCLVTLGLIGTAPSQNHLFTFKGDAATAFLGFSVSGAGDVNKDGYSDVIVGATGAKTFAGVVQVFSGKDGRVLHTFQGGALFDQFGPCSGAADVNKDGYADVIIGASGADPNGKSGAGIARVYSGKDGKVLYTFEGDAAGDFFGWSVSDAGDVNKDGFVDVIVGAFGADPNSKSSAGLARVLSGQDGTVLYTFEGDAAGDRMGLSVSGAGDVNKDGYADVIVGAAGADPNGKNLAGIARVFSGRDGSVLYSFEGSAKDQLGSSVSDAGDVNLDGFPDVIVGSVGANSRTGSARVYSGKDGKTLHTFVGDATGDALGNSVSGAGDVNLDGFADVIVGANAADPNSMSGAGIARVFSGKDGRVLYTFAGDAIGDGFGLAVSGAGDVNKDGVADVIAGAAAADPNNKSAAGIARVLSGKALSLSTDTHAFSVATTNTQTLSLDAGAANKNRLYWIFGSVTGTSPGVTLGSVTVPLRPDPWTELTIALANTASLVDTRGTLDGSGKATAQIKGGPVSASSIGLVLYHAALVYDAQGVYYLATNPTTLLLEK